MKKNIFLLVLFAAFSFLTVKGQLTGSKSIPGDYPSVAAAIAALNSSGVGQGGVTFNINAGHTETFSSVTDGLITASGSLTNPIVFQKSGSGAEPLITAATPGIGAYDYIFCFAGSDYITFDGIHIQDNPANTTNVTKMEYGFAFLKASPINGAQSNTIKNCTISLSFNTNAYGIVLENWLYNNPGSAVSVSSLDGTNSWNKIYNVVFNNCYGGINLKGFADLSLYDQDNEIGVDGGNSFTYNALAGTNVISYGINSINQNGMIIANNSFTGSMSMTTGRYYAMNLLDAHNADLDVFNNILTMSFTGTGHFYGFYINGLLSAQLGDANTVNFYNNQVINNTFPNHTNGNVVYTYVTVSALNLNIYGNVISNNTIGSATANSTGLAYYAYYRSDPAVQQIGTTNVYNNTISNNSRSSAASSVSSLTYFLYTTGQTNTLNIYGNVLDNNSAVASTAFGIITAHIGANKNIYNNQITNISGRIGSFTGLSNGNGIGNTYIHGNRIHNLSSSANPSPVLPTLYSLTGIYQGTGNNTYYYNNFISQIYAPFSANPSALIGIRILGINNNFTGLYNNTIYLDGTSVNEGFGARGIYAETGSELDMRNNNIVVNTLPTGQYGCNVAYYRTNNILDTYRQESNNNNFYAGTPGSKNYIYLALAADSLQTMAEYQAFVSPRDAQSITELPPFVNVTTSPYDLHLNGTILTLCESGGLVISDPLSITNDFDGNPRFPNSGYPDNPASPAIAPDIGADEFAGIYADLIAPSIAYTPLINTYLIGERILTATITDPSSVPTSGIGLPVLYWRINNGSWNASTAQWTSGNTYNFTLGAGAVMNDVVYYYVAAQDMAPSQNVGCRPPGGAGGFSSNPPACATPPASPDSYEIVGTLSGLYTVGIGKDYTTITDAVADLNQKEVVGPVIFELWDPEFSVSETFPIVINPYLGASPERPVTFRPKANGSSLINGSSEQGLLVLKGCQYIIIDGSNSSGTDRSLTWENTSTTAGSFAIGVYNFYPQGASDCKIQNNVIKCSSQLSVNTYGIYMDPNGGGYQNITIENNHIHSARYGVYFAGKWNLKATNGKLIKNLIGSLNAAEEIKFQGIVVLDAVNTLIQDNEIIGPASGNTNTNQTGVFLTTGAESSVIDRNIIHDFSSTNSFGRVSAINLATNSSETTTVISNNFIYGMRAGRNPSAIYLQGGGNVVVVHNTVNLTDVTFTSTATATSYSSCLEIGNSNLLDVRNNIFVNRQQCVNSSNVNPKTYAVYSSAPASAFNDINNNNYFVNDVVAVTGLSGRIGYLGMARNTLADWQVATGRDVQSTNLDPVFVAADNMMPDNQVLNNLGIYLPSFPDDFMGNLRTNPSDMGAVNFGNDPSVSTLSASDISALSANLNGVAMAAGQNINLYFDFGTSTNYGIVFNGTPPAASGVAPVSFNAGAISLNPNTNYHYRARGVSNSGLIVYGADNSFLTECVYPVVSVEGPVEICTPENEVMYQTEAGQTNYLWSVSTGGNITSGQGTPIITVEWIGSGLQTVSVSYTTIFGCTAQTPGQLEVSVYPRPTPTINGDVEVCLNDTEVYSTESGMYQYQWSISSGGQIIAGQGTNQITIRWNVAGNHDISVVYQTPSGCLPLVPTEQNVIVSPIPTPSISGNNIACILPDVNHILSTQDGNYNYDWTVSSGGTIISGQGTYFVEIQWNTPGMQFATVNYENEFGCSAAEPVTFNLEVLALPGVAGEIEGPEFVCAPTEGITYSIAPVSNADTYVWSVPAGVTITEGTDTNSITVDFETNAQSGIMSVYATNSCGEGLPSSNFIITVSTTPLQPIISVEGYILTSSSPVGNQWFFEGEAIEGAVDQNYIVTETGNYSVVVIINGCSSMPSESVYILITDVEEGNKNNEISVFPIPNKGQFTVRLSSDKEESWNISVFNSLLVEVYSKKDIRVNGIRNEVVSIENLSNGTYTIVLSNEKEYIIRKVLVSK